MLYIVRHGDAGDKHAWIGPDERRPLTDIGRHQALGLVKLLDVHPINAIVSSPTQRCVETVQPLARHRTLPVRTDRRLGVEADPGRAVSLVLDGPHDHTVWCTHGELIGEIMTRLGKRGAPIGDAPQWPKGSTWRLEVTAGEVISASYLPPAPE